MIAPLTVSFRKHFKASLVFCLQAHYDIQPALFTPFNQELVVKLPLAASKFMSYTTFTLTAVTPYYKSTHHSTLILTKYPAGEISGSARIVIPQTEFELALYSL